MVTNFTSDDLTRILREGAGMDEGVELADDVTFDKIGCDSLALLETCGRIEREYGVRFEDGDLEDLDTPRLLVEHVRSQLRLLAS